jgi:hypothetical protein
MPNLTFAISDELYKTIKDHPEIKWSTIARKALKDYYLRLEKMDGLLKDSKLTTEDVEKIGDLIKKGMWKRHKSAALEEK